MGFSISSSGFDTLPFKSWSFQEVFNEWADRAGPVLSDATKDQSPVRSGRLQSSVSYEIGGEAGGAGGSSTDNQLRILSYGIPYAGYVVSGTRPHDIHGNPLLSFQWNGKQSFYRSVHHPGTKANDFPQRAYDTTRDTIVAQMLSVLNESLGGSA